MTVSKEAVWYNPADHVADWWWDSGDDNSRTQAAVEGYRNQGQEKSWYNPASWVSDDKQAELTQKATSHMMNKGLGDLAGNPGTMESLQGGWQTHAPLLGGAAMGLGGLASGNPWMSILGLLSGGYGIYSAYNASKVLKDPKLLSMAAGQEGSNVEQAAAKKRIQQAYKQVQPYMGMAKSMGIDLGRTGVAPQVRAPVNAGGARAGTGGFGQGIMSGAMGAAGAGATSAPTPTPVAPVAPAAAAPAAPAAPTTPKKTASYAQKFLSNFEVSKLINEVRNDPGIDPRTAAEIIVTARNAQRMDYKPSPIINIGEFAQAAANGLGFEVGRNIASLMTLTPTIKNTIRRIGSGGLFSGAKALGVL